MNRLIVSMAAVLAASHAPAGGNPLTSWNVDANGPGRFVAAHGQRSLIMGYPSTGLEIWTYPLQILKGYQVRFREKGRIEPFEAQALLSRIEYGPAEVVRIYVGPDFVVREHLFVPLNAPSALITYDVEGRPDVEIEARFEPSLDLMWPGALGGQDVSWDEARSGYVEREPVHGFNAIIRSAEAIAHDSTINVATNRPLALGLVMAPRPEGGGVRRAHLIVSQGTGGSNAAMDLSKKSDQARSETEAHYAAVLNNAVEITTPDDEVNRALTGSILAVEESWVCAPDIGCGDVAGFGPSRPARRPQYAWYFAGDGLVAVESFVAAGRYERAREELEFIAKYQNKTNGMIWHEMSTSAPLIDWEKRYPYMFVHVDITLQYLSTLSHYVEATGDTAFLKAHWAGIKAAWRYARALVDPAIGLPTIPAGKEGQSEQAVVRDDIRLSSAWIDAAGAFARLARTEGDRSVAAEGDHAAEQARQSVRENYWDDENGFWFDGHTASGKPISEQRPGAANVLLQRVFTNDQTSQVLDRLASPEFQTDWGVRSLSSSNRSYDPNAYSAGAVWGLGSSGLSTVFWKEHRPFTAWNAWHGLVSWSSLDSAGHLHEVLAGDLFHPELESVPEQTWSSAGFISAAVGGLLGLENHAKERRISFAPHLPASWNWVNIRRVRVGNSRLDLRLNQDDGSTVLEVDNPGPPVRIDFDPQIPLGAHLIGADVNGVSTPVKITRTAQDEHAMIGLAAGAGLTRAVIRYAGGVRLVPVETPPRPGDRSVNLKLVSATLGGGALKLAAYGIDSDHNEIDVLTPMKILSIEGADISQIGKDRYRLRLRLPSREAGGVSGYSKIEVMARLANADGSQ